MNTVDNEYTDEFDKKIMKNKIKEIEKEKNEIENQNKDLKDQLNKLEKEKLINIYSKIYNYMYKLYV